MISDICSEQIKPSKTIYSRNGINLLLTNSKMEAYLQYVPKKSEDEEEKEEQQGAPQFHRDVIRQILLENKIEYGLKEEGIREFSQNCQEGLYYLVAEGKPPEKGKDADVEFVYEQGGGQGPQLQESESGRVDFKELHLNINVKKGEVLAIKHPATKGKVGYNVFGGEIKAKDGKDKHFPLGDHTEVSEDKLKLIATVDGTISRTSNRLSVVKTYTVKGDVDYSTGNISFVGSVEILGNVISGFRVEAQDDIVISGIVEDAVIVAGGNVTLRAGIQGGEKGEIRAGGTITGKFVNNARLIAGDSIIINGASLHSDLTAGDKIVLTGRQGQLSGGTARALSLVEAENIGTEMGISTFIEVGVIPELEKKRREIGEQLITLEENLKKLDKVVSTLKGLKKAKKELAPQQEKLLMDSIRTQYSYLSQRNSLKKEFEEAQQELNQCRAGHVKVRGAIYPGVRIKIRNVVTKSKHTMKTVTFSLEGGEIVTH
jgi:uncharacterized protein